mgnify:CR=1 FL=1|tara:strand:- start:220 stop:906 length:687 start_codon:yes stop_codon:yes gene_type:complete
MSLTIKSDGDFEALAVGQYEGVCYRIVDMGTRMEPPFKEGDKPKKRTTVNITFELPTEKMEDGRPLSISRTYTQSLFESSALRKDLVSWRGKNFTPDEEAGFDISNLLGKNALIEVAHTANGKAKIGGIFKPDGGVQETPTHNELVAFDMDVYCDEFNGNSSEKTKAMCDIFDTLPEWQQRDIEDSFEYKAANKDDNATVEEAEVVEEESNGLAGFQAEEDDNDTVPF